MDDDDEQTMIAVGNGGTKVQKSLFNFKLLCFDTLCQNLIAPIMKVGALREHNMTLHLNLDSKAKREAVPEVACVYLVEPTQQSFKQIANDSANNLYDFVFVNFSRPV
jgi:hypothetical protein